MQLLDIGKLQTLNIENRHFWEVLRNQIAQFSIGARHMNRLKQRTQPCSQGLGYCRIFLQNNDTQTHKSPPNNRRRQRTPRQTKAAERG